MNPNMKITYAISNSILQEHHKQKFALKIHPG